MLYVCLRESSSGHPSNRRDHVPSKISVRGERSESRVTAPKVPPLTMILVGTRLERREDVRSRISAVGGRDGGRPVTGGARGSAGAAARRAP
jgi:hypothetical protein